MRHAAALLLTLFLCASPACQRQSEERPAPDMAAPPAAGEPSPSPTAAETARDAATEGATPTRARRESDFQYLAQIRNAREEAKGKFARMYLKLWQRAKTPGWVTMISTDGSYSTALLHYRDEFKPMVDEMQPGYVYELEFEINRVSTGGQPQGEILAIDRKSAGPVRDETKFLPAIEAVERARNLPPEVKEARREAFRKRLTGIVDTVEGNKEEIEEVRKELSNTHPGTQ